MRARASFGEPAILIHDRDPLYTDDFRGILRAGDVDTVKLPVRSPTLNAYAERLVRSIKSECLSKIIPLGKRHLRQAVGEFTETLPPGTQPPGYRESTDREVAG